MGSQQTIGDPEWIGSDCPFGFEPQSSRDEDEQAERNATWVLMKLAKGVDER